MTRPALIRIAMQAALFFALFNVLFATFDSVALVGQVSLYNGLLPGRDRLPYGETPDAYNLSLYDLNAMFRAHEVSAAPAPDEYRVFVIGDSSVWGVLLRPDDTIAAQLDAIQLTAPDGRQMRFYNLGYPQLSTFKDLLLLDHAMRYRPDMIVWLTTLDSLVDARQFTPLVFNNAADAQRLIGDYRLSLDANDPGFVQPTFAERTIVGQRRALADWLRLQLYGVMWWATDIDQVYPTDYARVTADYDADVSWQGIDAPRPLTDADLAFDVLAGGHERTRDMPVLMVNEPIYISEGQNNDLRYNLWYPRWAYDDYRAQIAQLADARGWHYLDAWDAVPPELFTDSPVHMNAEGVALLAERIQRALMELVE